ncbi:hypothetical protein L3Q65_00385 (plasmid) [Amycolatopsis sp. FU40]|uniref:hypothetical protein n=1 Tax=Amycolatopsis sp. FU40 TaxID=2914159 RepID=UPI001F202E6E|nr:hypothetical protein [Amycolatopsis sp. FU40]UKD50786.1 hypothetical protein L3Q65_00385 [Amycolatopsis sp. FU40]
MTAQRKIEDVVSGEQIVQADGRGDRVHGVDRDREQGAVFVTTDRRRDVRFVVGTRVTIV